MPESVRALCNLSQPADFWEMCRFVDQDIVLTKSGFRVIAGWDALDAMEKVPGGPKDRPTQDIILHSVTVHANPIADAAFQ